MIYNDYLRELQKYLLGLGYDEDLADLDQQPTQIAFDNNVCVSTFAEFIISRQVGSRARNFRLN